MEQWPPIAVWFEEDEPMPHPANTSAWQSLYEAEWRKRGVNSPLRAQDTVAGLTPEEFTILATEWHEQFSVICRQMRPPAPCGPPPADDDVESDELSALRAKVKQLQAILRSR